MFAKVFSSSTNQEIWRVSFDKSWIFFTFLLFFRIDVASDDRLYYRRVSLSAKAMQVGVYRRCKATGN